ncbi:MAG: GNAT family N-acetyltransferase [Dehalococcoidales bacterium]|nr:MAG: GNAT family N-acetyltransferase [Dehalococcoidales bacterium]
MGKTTIDNSEKSIISITKDTLEEATEVLAMAFQDDPIINYFLSGHTENYAEKQREIFRYQCLMYIEMGLSIFGAVKNSVITGIACLAVPEKKKRPDSLIESDKEFEKSMGQESIGRIKRYMKLNKKHTPEGPHHYLAALGVHPDFQGHGFGRLLLDRVNEITESHQTSTGIFLETAKLENVEMYRYFGYNLLATEKLDGIVDKWYMFRPVKKND